MQSIQREDLPDASKAFRDDILQQGWPVVAWRQAVEDRNSSADRALGRAQVDWYGSLLGTAEFG